MDASSSSAACQRKLYVFTCGCQYLSPHPCKCCPELKKPLKFPGLALPPTHDLRVKNAGRTAFRMQCAQCQIMGLEIKQETAKQIYQDTLELWGEYDEDAPQHYNDYNKANRSYERLSKAIKRDTPNVEGWEVLE